MCIMKQQGQRKQHQSGTILMGGNWAAGSCVQVGTSAHTWTQPQRRTAVMNYKVS